jgi:hypothetical protein
MGEWFKKNAHKVSQEILKSGNCPEEIINNLEK